MRKLSGFITFSLILTFFSASAFSNESPGSIGTSFAWGKNFKSFGIDATYGLDPKKEWTGILSLDHSHSSGGSNSNTNGLMLGVDHDVDADQFWKAGLAFSKDTTNQIGSFGPTGGYTYTWNTAPSPNALDNEELGDEILTIGLNADLFFYSAELEVTASGKTLPGKKGNPPPPSVTATRTATVRTTMFHPSLELDKSFLDDLLTPSVSGGYYLYTRPPSDIESASSLRNSRLTADLSSVNAMTDSFLKASWEIALSILARKGTRFRLSYGQEQSAIDNNWSTIARISWKQDLGNHFQARLGYSRAGQAETTSNTFTLGLIYLL